MPQFFLDALDLARFRGKSLDRYTYDWRIPLLWMTALGCLPAFDSGQFTATFAERLVFWVGLTWAHSIAMSLFIGTWVRQGKRWQGNGSFFPLVVLITSSNLFLAPLLILLVAGSSGELLPIALLAMLVYHVAVFVHALKRATGISTGHALMGRAMFLLVEFVLLVLASQLALGLGWIDPEAISKELATESQPADLPAEVK
jgi:hypothetical protein